MSVIIRWFPPSWLQIKTPRKVLYIDPAWIQKNFENYPHKVIYSHYPDPMDGLPEPDLEKADIIFYTHHHQDHIKKATLDRLSTPQTTIIAPEKCRALIGREFGVIQPGDERIIDGIHIHAIHAYNTTEGHSTRKQHHRGECVGYVLTIEGKSIYHAGDTDLIAEMKELKDIDIAFLPIGGTFTMDPEEAAAAAHVIKPKIVIPMHYLHADPQSFVRVMEQKTNSRVRLLEIGDSVTF